MKKREPYAVVIFTNGYLDIIEHSLDKLLGDFYLEFRYPLEEMFTDIVGHQSLSGVYLIKNICIVINSDENGNHPYYYIESGNAIKKASLFAYVTESEKQQKNEN